MAKQRVKSLVSSLVLVLGLLALSCAPAAPTPAPTPTEPGVPQLPAPAKPAPAPAAKKMVVVAMPMSPSGATSTIQAIVLSKLLQDHSTWLRASVMLVSGFVKAVEFWEKGKEQGIWVLPFSQGMMEEYARGTGIYKVQGPRKDQGLLWPGFLNSICWLSRQGSRFKTMADMKGAKLGLSEVGTTALQRQKYVLEVGLGLKEGEYKAVYAGFVDEVAIFKEGTVEVVSLPHVGARGAPYAWVEDVAGSVNTYFIPMTPQIIDKINKTLGAEVYFLHPIPAGLYRNQTSDVPMLTDINFYTLPLNYPQDVAYELCRVWWDYWDQGVEINTRVALSEPEMCRTALKKKWAFEWHPGALKYYKEKGWI